MVDYNNDATISTPPGDILKVAILERRAYFINAVEKYKQVDARGGYGQDHVVKAALYALFLELQAALKKDLDNKKPGEKKSAYEILREQIEAAADTEKAMAAYLTISEWLYDKNLTKFDTRKAVDTTDVEAVNLEHGL